eukprot:6681870-Alexandrium_andersonii.AAC.1
MARFSGPVAVQPSRGGERGGARARGVGWAAGPRCAWVPCVGRGGRAAGEAALLSAPAGGCCRWRRPEGRPTLAVVALGSQASGLGPAPCGRRPTRVVDAPRDSAGPRARGGTRECGLAAGAVGCAC